MRLEFGLYVDICPFFGIITRKLHISINQRIYGVVRAPLYLSIKTIATCAVYSINHTKSRKHSTHIYVTMSLHIDIACRRTFSPGCHLVPLCLRIISPTEMASPPNFFTPSLLAIESRPFLEVFALVMFVAYLTGWMLPGRDTFRVLQEAAM